MELSQGLKDMMGQEEDLSKMSHSELIALRDTNRADKDFQNKIAPFEHRAFTRERVKENPLTAPALAVIVPGYNLAKALGIREGSSDTLVEATKQGLKGIGEGLRAFLFPDEASNTAKGKITRAPHVMDKHLEKLYQVESGGKHTDAEGRLTESPKGALGIAQIMPKAGANPGYGVPPLVDNSPEQQKIYATNYLRKMYDIFGSKERAFAAYNAGPGAVHRAIAKGQRQSKDWKLFVPEETRNYIEKNLNEPTPKTK